MKIRIKLLLALTLITPSACADRATYKLRKAIENSHVRKVNAALSLAGQLDPEDKNKFLKLADDIVDQRKKLTMSALDWVQVVSGGLLSLSFFKAIVEVLDSRDKHNTQTETSRLRRNALVSGAVGMGGLLLIANGLFCRAARARLRAAYAIEDLLEAAPQKSFNGTLEHPNLRNKRI